MRATLPVTRRRKPRRPAKARRTRAFPRRGHDHGSCIESALERAASVCARKGLQLTPLRRRVLELVWRSHEPVGAYEVLNRLRRRGRAAAPPTVYRVLEFLLAYGLVHRIESRNAYVGCARPESRHASQFLICGKCGITAELADAGIRRAVVRGAKTAGFSVEQETIEVTGLCPRCAPRRRKSR